MESYEDLTYNDSSSIYFWHRDHELIILQNIQ